MVSTCGWHDCLHRVPRNLQKALELKSELGKFPGDGINEQKSTVFLHTSHEEIQRVKRSTTYNYFQGEMLRCRSNKTLQDLCADNHKIPKKAIREDKRNGRCTTITDCQVRHSEDVGRPQTNIWINAMPTKTRVCVDKITLKLT